MEKTDASSVIHAHGETRVGRDAGATYMPAVDIIDGEKELELALDVPGVLEGDVDLTVEKSVLTIRARPKDGVCEGKDLIYSEYGVGEYCRSFSLTEDIDVEGITAVMEDGVLRVRLPKREPVLRKISVGGGGA